METLEIHTNRTRKPITMTPKEKAKELRNQYGHYAVSFARGALDAHKDMYINGITGKKNKEKRDFWTEVINNL